MRDAPISGTRRTLASGGDHSQIGFWLLRFSVSESDDNQVHRQRLHRKSGVERGEPPSADESLTWSPNIAPCARFRARVIGVAFWVAAWRPPVNDSSKRRPLVNPEGKRWRATPYRPERMLEQIVLLLILACGVGLLSLGTIRIIG